MFVIYVRQANRMASIDLQTNIVLIERIFFCIHLFRSMLITITVRKLQYDTKQ